MKAVAAKAACTFLIVLGGLVAGKLCQLAPLALLKPRLGFDLASLAGLAPFVSALLWLSARHPRYFSFAAMWRRRGG
jgi:hypothetical protein